MGRGVVGRIGKWFGAILRVLADKLCRKDLNMRFCLNSFYVVFCGEGEGGCIVLKKEKKNDRQY